MKIQITHAIDTLEIAESIQTQKEALALILEVDLAMCDYEFTCKVIRALVSSLKKDEPKRFSLNDVLGAA